MDVLDAPTPTALAAQQAAEAAGVVVRELDEMPAIEDAAGLMDRVWNASGVMPSNLLRAIQFGGGYLTGAYAGEEMVGASVAFLGMHGEEDASTGFPLPETGAAWETSSRRVLTLHSHITGVLGANKGVGYAMKLHQRAWCLERGVAAITWTFDPLVSRNAYFNLTKLGAVGLFYLPDHYGEMTDGINAGQGSDRLLAWWTVDPDQSPEPLSPTGPLPHVLLDRDEEARPVRTGDAPAGVELVAIAAPMDIEGLRLTDPAASRNWRLAVREAMGGAMQRGFRARGMTRDGYYLLDLSGGQHHPTTRKTGTSP